MGLTTICLSIGIMLIVLGFATMQITQSERVTARRARPKKSFAVVGT